MFGKKIFLGAALIVFFLVFGCAQPNGGSSREVTMANDQFFPQTIQVNSGDSVIWRNNDSDTHTVTGFGVDERVSPGQTFRYTFSQGGTFEYKCTIHQGMSGTVIVSGAATP
ncbi:MAG: cupredoxin domain-containing protein [Candidatus Diapherotrites archaeon]|nr:cupredoxin domain-containing protein [Candidatus Diapherotrites archaeon]